MWSSWIVQLLVTSVHAILALAFGISSDKGLFCTSVVACITILVPQFACLVSIYSHSRVVDQVCIPLSFFGHLVHNCIGLYRVLKVAPPDAQQACEKELGSDCSSGAEDHNRVPDLVQRRRGKGLWVRRLCVAGS